VAVVGLHGGVAVVVVVVWCVVCGVWWKETTRLKLPWGSARSVSRKLGIACDDVKSRKLISGKAAKERVVVG
jgi:hypothetical protein